MIAPPPVSILTLYVMARWQIDGHRDINGLSLVGVCQSSANCMVMHIVTNYAIFKISVFWAATFRDTWERTLTCILNLLRVVLIVWYCNLWLLMQFLCFLYFWAAIFRRYWRENFNTPPESLTTCSNFQSSFLKNSIATDFCLSLTHYRLKQFINIRRSL